MLIKPIVFVAYFPTVPKERPRIDKNSSHYSPRYANFQATAKAALMAAVGVMPATIVRHFPLTKVKIEIEFHGSVNVNSDLDNDEGAWWDALVQAKVISGDNVRKVNENNSKYFESSHPVTVITIYPNWQPVSTVDPKLLIPPIPSRGKTEEVKPAKAKAVRHSNSAAMFGKCKCLKCNDLVKRSSASAARKKAEKDVKK